MAFRKITVDDKRPGESLATVQDNVELALLDMAYKPLTNATIASDLALTTVNTAVRHGLGGPPRGWIPVKLTAVVTIYSDTAHPEPTEWIYLKSSAAATVSLLFL